MGRWRDTERAIRLDCGYMDSGILDDGVDVGIDDSWRLHTLRDRGREGAPHFTCPPPHQARGGRYHGPRSIAKISAAGISTSGALGRGLLHTRNSYLARNSY